MITFTIFPPLILRFGSDGNPILLLCCYLYKPSSTSFSLTTFFSSLSSPKHPPHTHLKQRLGNRRHPFPYKRIHGPAYTGQHTLTYYQYKHHRPASVSLGFCFLHCRGLPGDTCPPNTQQQRLIGRCCSQDQSKWQSLFCRPSLHPMISCPSHPV